MTFVVIWLLTFGYTMLYMGVVRFAGTPMTFGQALGFSQGKTPTTNA